MNNDDQERLYQFSVNALGSLIRVNGNFVPAHTLQVFLSRDDAFELLLDLVKQLKTDDRQIVVELKGWMLLVDEIQPGFRNPEDRR